MIFFFFKDIMSITFSQYFSPQILSIILLLTINNKQQNNFSSGFKLKTIIIYYLKFVVKIL